MHIFTIRTTQCVFYLSSGVNVELFKIIESGYGCFNTNDRAEGRKLKSVKKLMDKRRKEHKPLRLKKKRQEHVNERESERDTK